MSNNGERQEDILQLRFAGLTYQQIANRLHISRQRVHQLIAPSEKIRDMVARRANGRCESCGIQVNGSGHVHHISCYGENYNDTRNLQLLCASCHRKAHSMPKSICPICGKPKANSRLYCSRECWSKAHQVQLTCATCGKTFYRRISVTNARFTSVQSYRRSDRYFCSRECQGKWLGQKYGKDNLTPYWENVQKDTVLECMRCGYKWHNRVDNPVICPHCKSRLWNKPRKTRKDGH